jgi:UDP-N-acetylglucosamine--dolichyl-phosphate N-acetylglucosaminephosphotransferase
MLKSILLVSGVSFIVTIFVLPWLIKYLKSIELVVLDQNKESKPLIPISGGIAVATAIIASMMVLIFAKTLLEIPAGPEAIIDFLAISTSLLIVVSIGLIDDLLIRKSKESSMGLRQWQKPLLTVLAAIPLIAIKAGDIVMTFPFIGTINLSWVYPLILVPIGFIGATNMVNMLAGFNGLEAGMGLIYTGMLGAYAVYNNSYIAAVLAFATFASLLVFFWFNKYPAKIFPGDSLTYLLGGVIACIAIVGNLEKAALIASIPFFIEFVLKARGKFKKQSYGYYKDGKVKSLYDKIYSLPHIWTRTGKYTEKQITYFLIIAELVFASLIWVI